MSDQQEHCVLSPVGDPALHCVLFMEGVKCDLDFEGRGAMCWVDGARKDIVTGVSAQPRNVLGLQGS